MSVDRQLRQLPEPDERRISHLRDRFDQSRAQRSTRLLPWALVGATLMATAAVLSLMPEAACDVPLRTDGVTALAWSDTVALSLQGHGRAQGTSHDLVIDWEMGTLDVNVVPKTGTSVVVQTQEGTVRVLGTVFQVTRDALGATTSVSRGKVQVDCEDGWSVVVTVERGPHTCLRTGPGGLLRRADALEERGESSEVVLQTLNRGLSIADSDAAVYGELLVRRMQLHAAHGPAVAAFVDADRYLALGQQARTSDVLRLAGRLALSSDGCDRAERYLAPLSVQGTAEDQLMWASCLAARDLPAAKALAQRALERDEAIDANWKTWGDNLMGGSR
ncbi:MAG: hypothetical protein GWP91_01105 [Rhodobacterales bacterium]|nr:hypothetical protein [Rhodobacterales bacterium]